jgi:hypothetical protein
MQSVRSEVDKDVGTIAVHFLGARRFHDRATGVGGTHFLLQKPHLRPIKRNFRQLRAISSSRRLFRVQLQLHHAGEHPRPATFASAFMSYIDGHIDHRKDGPPQRRSKTESTGKRMTKQPFRDNFRTPKQGKGIISKLISLNT